MNNSIAKSPKEFSSPLFRIRPARASSPKSDGTFFVLEQDNWNDFRFRTQYQLYFAEANEAGEMEEILIGDVKILRRGQRAGDPLPVVEDFDSLNDEFCSLGQSLDYYERINSLGEGSKSTVLVALRDAIYEPDHATSFSSEAGWKTSLLRDQRDTGAGFISLARGLLTGDYSETPSVSTVLSFHIPEWTSSVDLRFDAPRSSAFPFDRSTLPGRIAVAVGKNGSGKSTFLARLARVAFATPTERQGDEIKQLGSLEPVGIGFPRIVTIAFSPFDSFHLPGTSGRNREQVMKDLEKGEGRFSFIGLRDLLAESRLQEPSFADANSFSDRQGQTRLKSIDQLAGEFVGYIEKIRRRGRTGLFVEVAQVISADSVFSEHDWSGGNNQSERQLFMRCSTGHKIVFLILAGLLSSIEPYSLVLVDEPETHLHPPLLAAMMHALRTVLEKHEAFAVVATHSPVVLQETLASHVVVVRRSGERVVTQNLSGETFGESIGLITAEVFGLQSDATDFHRVLDGLIRERRSVASIEALFNNGAMSHQARAYVMSRMSGKDVN